MSESIGEEQARAEALRRQQEYIRRQRILEEIEELEEKISECEKLKVSFNVNKTGVTTAAMKLENCTAVTFFNAREFAGITATAAEQGVANAQASIKLKAVNLNSVASAIDAQIGKLDTYILELKGRVNRLRGCL